jgi:hypothetical protein
VKTKDDGIQRVLVIKVIKSTCTISKKQKDEKRLHKTGKESQFQAA